MLRLAALQRTASHPTWPTFDVAVTEEIVFETLHASRSLWDSELRSGHLVNALRQPKSYGEEDLY